MKICTITCHDVYNHGASLQAYGLMTYLLKMGHDVEIIDYKPDYLSNHYNIFSISNPKWNRNFFTKFIYLTIKIPSRIPGLKRKKVFDQFTSNYLRVTKSRFTSNEELKRNIPNADVFICGSDQIWNCLHKNGKDPAFYLDFVPNEKIKVSYAASFATDEIPDEYKNIVKSRIEKLDGVSLREKSGVEIVKKLGVNKAVNVIDPVFLLEKEDWNKIGTKEIKEKYILIYDFDNSDLIKKIAKQISNETVCKIYTINQNKLKYADKYYIFEGPETFVSLIRNAEFVISNSFHAAVFSIIYEKDFIIVNRTENINTRMRDLLDDLKLNERLVSENYNLDQLLKKIDYKETKKILDSKIRFSQKFLEDVLSEPKKVRNIL
ncbi:polysaccharide pyruvyl transferase family protein [Metabacillus sediminilitoris]|uniref:Polysaccharide pyruvyl transferase family protein n=1 Tax=Metabacillus sediminilitoris TaxID=2567941 RepID=A0A4V3WFJ8_9BACI|nr:polysaccharide pyruvyl transferase family protein [Metabacillus sediminilitoris]QGQ47218.1 polysaccharide pyruvyl transferase family protein [Metabacillus sediminilitoris]THF80562.1 polysaccharide pyruvyl transferase family protein [Metabacillus sediminilitoris]